MGSELWWSRRSSLGSVRCGATNRPKESGSKVSGVLALLALSSFYAVTPPTGSWLSFCPGAVVLPLLLWLTARCPPAFGIAGAFVASITVLWATSFGVGHFGDASVPLMERVNGARVVITMVTLCTLVLAALFAERRRNEATLRDSNNRMRLALSAEEE